MKLKEKIERFTDEKDLVFLEENTDWLIKKVQNLLDKQRKEIIKQHPNAFDDDGNPIRVGWR